MSAVMPTRSGSTPKSADVSEAQVISRAADSLLAGLVHAEEVGLGTCTFVHGRTKPIHALAAVSPQVEIIENVACGLAVSIDRSMCPPSHTVGPT
jgi:hypothetical protein